MFRLAFVLTLGFFLANSFRVSQKKSPEQTSGPTTKQSSCETVSQVSCCKDGKDGKDGRNGKDGRDGLHGKNGRDGRDGRDGAHGAKGEKGELGAPGQDGKTGIKGVKGTPGDKGQTGQQGPGLGDAQGSSLSSSKRACCKTEYYPGFHFFEKFQDLPTRGAFAVEYFTINETLFLAFANYHGDINGHKTSSTIYKMDESIKRFTLYQTLQTRGAYGLEYFSIANKHFLAVANHYDQTYSLESVIYQWNGKLFVLFQKIPTKGASHFTFFTINSEKHLAVTNYNDGSTNSLKSVIYKWSGSQFNKFQEIATEGAMGCEAFVINNNTFLAFANYYNSQRKYSAQSTVFKWSGGHFVKMQSLQTYGARDVKSFNINGHTFLAFANYYSGSKYNTDSFIYKWDGNKFVLFQSVPTRGALTWHPLVINGQMFLGVANYHGDSQKHNTQSVVYQASGSRFVNYQEIPTHGATDMTSFEYKGHIYLAVANQYSSQKYNINSALYKWE